MPALSSPGELEGVRHDAVRAVPGEHALLDHGLAVGALEHPSAGAGVLPLGVLPHDVEVDVADLPAGERRADPRHQPDRSQVDVLVELAAELDEHAPQRDVVRHRRRPADGTEEDGVVASDLVLPVRRHHRAVLEVVLRAPVEVVVLDVDVEPTSRGVEDQQSLRDHLLADAVARDDGDPVWRHVRSPSVRNGRTSSRSLSGASSAM